MKYQGIIKKSRSLDAAAILAIINAVFPVLQTQLPQLGLDVQDMALVNIAGAGVMAYLRTITKGPVGVK